MTELTAKALLVSLKISQWSARKLDRQETAALAARHGTPSEVARVNKSLLPMAQSLDAIHKETNRIRWEYYRHSLPWGQEGINVIASAGYLDFACMMRDNIDGWRHLVTAFVGQYDTLRQNAALVMGSLYKADDYPPACEVAGKFSIACSFYPIPEASAWETLIGLDEEEKAALVEQTVLDRMASQNVAMQDAWRRVYEVVSHAAEKLGDPKGIFRDSMVDNAVKLCRTLTTLNIASDPELERIRQEIEGTLCRQNPEVLRADPLLRADVSERMKTMVDRMGAFYAPE